MEKVCYKELKEDELNLNLFSSFNRYQEVKKCWRKVSDKWILKDIIFTERWGLSEYKYLIECLQKTIETGGAVFGAFHKGVLVGFASIENEFFGLQKDYLQLSSIHISYENRGRGIGENLFSLICNKAKEMGAEKLYISAHSSQETMNFYNAMGCVGSVEYNRKLVDEEPYDCQLEYGLSN